MGYIGTVETKNCQAAALTHCNITVALWALVTSHIVTYSVTTGGSADLPSRSDTNCTISNCSVGIDIFYVPPLGNQGRSTQEAVTGNGLSLFIHNTLRNGIIMLHI